MGCDSNNVVPAASAQVKIPIVAQVIVMPTVMSIFVSLGEKSKKFNGLNFKMWQHKILFYMTTKNLARFFTKDALKLKEYEHDI